MTDTERRALERAELVRAILLEHGIVTRVTRAQLDTERASR